MKTNYKRILIFLFFLSCTLNSFASATLFNYDFNLGSFYPDFSNNALPNVTCTISGTPNYTISTAGTATGPSAFTSNLTGNSLQLTNSSGTNINGFTLALGGSDLSKYCSYQIYFQSKGTASGAQTLTIYYSIDNVNYFPFSRKTATISTTNWNEAVIDMGGINELNSAPAIYFKILASGASGTSAIYIDNLQIAASYMNISTHGIKNFPRGLYVQDFIKFIGDPEALVVDRNRTILGNSVEEDKLLNYCKKNNFNYLVFYDISLLQYIYTRTDDRTGKTFGEDFCHFLKKAEDFYCITDFGVAGSRTDFYSDLYNNNQSPVYSLTVAEKNLLAQNSPVRLVEQILPSDDPRIPMVEYFKFLFNITNLNTPNAYRSSGMTSTIQCSNAHFNVMTVEDEFWNDRDKPPGNSTPGNQVGGQYRKFLELARSMNDIKRIQENAGNIVYTELYLAFLEDTCSCNWMGQTVNCPTFGGGAPIASGNATENQYVANTLDPLFDRFLSTYYGIDEYNIYHHPTNDYIGQNYVSKFLSLGRSNPPNSIIQPLFNSESQASGGGENIFGLWLAGWSDAHGRDVRSFNIYTAEKDFYDQWYADNTVDAKDNPQEPGASHWFASTSLFKNTSDPEIFRSNSPVCAGSNTSAVVDFIYQGPINKGARYDFSVKKGSVTYINLVDQEWPEYDPITQTGITLPSVVLPKDDANQYNAHLKIYYSRFPSGCEYEVTIPVLVRTGLTIQANRPTTMCQGDYVVLTASEGATGYSWSNPVSTTNPNGRFGTIINAAPNNYTVTCTSNGGTCSGTASIPITINQNYGRFQTPAVLTSVTCDPNTPGTVLTGFNSLYPGCTWTWGDGTTGFPKQISESTDFSAEFIQSNGCKFTDTYNFTQPNLRVASGGLNILCSSNSSVNFVTDNGNVFNGDVVNIYKDGVWLATLSNPWTYTATLTGTYTVTGVINGICITSNPIDVIQSTSLVVTSSTVCAGQHPSPPVQCNARGSSSGITFNWYQNGSLISGANRYFVTVAPTSTSVYSCSITTTAGCTANASGTVTVNPNPTITSAITPTTCTGICAGQIAISASGGSSFSYKWGNGGPTTAIVTNLCAGEYNVVVTNNLGCKATATPNVLQTTSGSCTADLEICSGQKSSDLINFGTYQSGQSVVIHADLTIDQDFSFVNSDVILDPNVKIIINTGIRLTIDNSVLRKCPSLANWYGIVVDEERTLIVRNNSTLKEAINAIDVKNSGRVAAMNSNFLKNEVSISFNGGDCFHSEIYGNLFDFGNLDPKANTAKAHIQGNNISYLKIGKTGESSNLFKHALTAIDLTDPVDGIIENNEFTALGQLVMDDNLQWVTKGYGIHVSGGSVTGMNVKIRGTGTNDDRNYFHDLENSSIYIEKYIDSEIFGNMFENLNGGVSLFQNYGKVASIHDNHFRDFNFGIDMVEMADASISVEHNDFNMETPAIDTASSVPLLFPVIRRYGFLGIGLQNGDRSTLTYNCNQNWISNTKYSIHVRNVTNVALDFIQINENQLFFSKDVTKITGFEKGIWIENSDYVKIFGNKLYSNLAPTNFDDAQHLIGIDFAYLQHGLIQENKIINYGYSMAAKGKCTDTRLGCNDFYLYYYGLMCNRTDRPTISEQGDYWGSDLSWDNIWDPEGSIPSNYRIAGRPLQVIDWDYRVVPGPSADSYLPTPFEQNIFPQQVANYDCYPPSFTSIEERNYKYSEVIAPNNFGSDPDSLFYRYLANEYYLRGIKADISLLNLNTPFDALYNAKYLQFLNSNIGKYEEVRKLINEKELIQADLKLQTIIDENVHELNKKTFFGAYERFLNDSGTVDSSDIETLTNLAYESPLYGGEAVYNARALLKLYIEDDALSTSRKTKPKFYLDSFKNRDEEIEIFDLYPNPANDYLVISLLSPITTEAYLEIADQLGNRIEFMKLNINTSLHEISTSSLAPGIYFVTIQIGRRALDTKKIVIIR